MLLDIIEPNADQRRNTYEPLRVEGDVVGTSLFGGHWRCLPVQGDVSCDFIKPDGSLLSPFVVDIMARRDVLKHGHDWLEPSFKAFMPDPSLLSDMDVLTSRLASAISCREKIGIIGDYDVDGATSTAIMVRYFRALGLVDVDGALSDEAVDGHKVVLDPDAASKDILYHIPQRYPEGYGTSVYALEKMKAWGAKVLLILDSGTASHDPVSLAKEMGFTVLIVDHHSPTKNDDGTDNLPCADALVNPKRVDDRADLAHLCTAGLAFMLIVSLNRHLKSTLYFKNRGMAPVDIQMFLGLTALGTMADVMNLWTLNRAFVTLGLRYMAYIPGLVALTDVINGHLKEKYGVDHMGRVRYGVGYTSKACGFSFGPCINACGRINDSSLGVRLLVSDDIDEITSIAAQMYDINEERKAIEKDIRSVCEAQVEAMIEARGSLPNVIVAYDKTWHSGVVGIVASRLKDKYNRPALVIGTYGKGSARSFDNFNIGKAFHDATEKGLILGGGGHHVAAGMALHKSEHTLTDDDILQKVRALSDFLNQEALGFQPPDSMVDGVIDLSHVSTTLAMDMDYLAPFGQGNRSPEIVITGGFISEVRIAGKGTLRGVLKNTLGDSLVFMNFQLDGTPLGQALLDALDHSVSLKGFLEINDFAGRRTAQLKVTDVEVHDFLPS